MHDLSNKMITKHKQTKIWAFFISAVTDCLCFHHRFYAFSSIFCFAVSPSLQFFIFQFFFEFFLFSRPLQIIPNQCCIKYVWSILIPIVFLCNNSHPIIGHVQGSKIRCISQSSSMKFCQNAIQKLSKSIPFDSK